MDNNLKDVLNKSVSQTVRQEFIAAGLFVILGVLNCVVNKGASCLIRVPSNQFTVIATPILFMAGVYLFRNFKSYLCK